MGQLSISYTVIGEVTDRGVFEYGNVSITMDEALRHGWTTLEDVFPNCLRQGGKGEVAALEEKLYHSGAVYICDHKMGQPPYSFRVFPGTNCEYDSAKGTLRGQGPEWLPGCCAT